MHRDVAFLFSCALGAAAFVACTTGTGDVDGGSGLEPRLAVISEEIFTPNCSTGSCHDSDGPANDLDLASDGVYARLVDVDSVGVAGMKRVVAGDPDASLLYVAVNEGHEPEVRKMPPGTDLAAEKIEAIRQWIEDGAEDN